MTADTRAISFLIEPKICVYVYAYLYFFFPLELGVMTALDTRFFFKYME